MVTPQSKVGGTRSPRGLMEAIAGNAQDYIVHPTKLITANGEALPRGKNDKMRILQNCGTVAVKYLLSDVEDARADHFHGVLMAGAAQDDGSGGVIDFSNISTRISIYAASAPRVAVVRITAPEALL